MKLCEWLQGVVSGKPHFVIGGKDEPYLLRWYLIPRNRWLNIYLHKFLRDDDDRALHDHPWWFISVILKGFYFEKTETGVKIRRRLSMAYRPAVYRHRVFLPIDKNLQSIPCWTLIITGPKVREWGFWCPQGFVVWTDYVSSDNPGVTGKGCDQ